jgi:hypothetical protein
MARKKPANGKPARSSRKKRGKAENMTGAKEAKVEVRKAELDLQPVEINDQDFDLHFKAVRSAQERVGTAQSIYRTCMKNAKKVSPELHDAIKDALKFDGMQHHDIKRQMEIAGYVLRKTGSSVQLTIHDSLLGDTKEAYYKRGFSDGEAGKTADARAPEGSDLASEYMRGWRHGTSKNMGMTPEQSDAALASVGHNSGTAEGATVN